ncbi:MAG: LLM class flavin-dependent oxidoreductase [Alphaproteobacteria bacterium]|nr:LLM class flavin-dependent oxidoreductase [Alphaproteobacteria bacterium]
MKRQLHLNLFFYARGHHEAAWRHPRAPQREVLDIDHIVACARKAEAANMDSIFLADTLGLAPDSDRTARMYLDPLTTLAAVAMATSRIGLIGTASTTHSEPFNIARMFASLDHISRGRAGWNIVTSFSIAGANNFDSRGRRSHADRYERADEFVEVAKKLWDSWADDAVLDDRVAGYYYRRERVRPIDHHGPHYDVAGPLNIPRGPQGRPVLVQAGSSDTGRDFAARHAEAVFTAHMTKATAQAFYKDLKARAVASGRPGDQCLILPGISMVIAGTEAEARRMERELNEMADIGSSLSRLSQRFDGHDFSHIPLDRALTAGDFPDPAENQSSRGRTELIVGAVEREKLTMRQLLGKLAGARGHFVMAGTPEQVADTIEEWIDDGAADGFNVMPLLLPHMLDVFADEVVPILKRRGRFRTEYAGATLRDHYGLQRPAA